VSPAASMAEFAAWATGEHAASFMKTALPIFQQACKMGLEGIVSKRLSAPYRSGPSRDWIK
jgi:bifunctional non-homologous end joining protein LigD